MRNMRTEREAAVVTLVKSLERAYPERGFKIHPSLAFLATEGGGLRAVTKTPIDRDEILLVVPASARLANWNLSEEEGDDLERILDATGLKCNELQQNSDGLFHVNDQHDFVAAVAVMRAASGVGLPGDTVRSAHAATWPSEDDVRSMPVHWDAACVGIGGKGLLRELLDERGKLLRAIFDGAVWPVLSRGGAARFTLPGAGQRHPHSARDALWESFVYAFIIVFSRSHSGRDGDSLDERLGPEIVPLVELFNGADDDGDTNVQFVSGMWPFIRGKMFRNECDLPCGAVYAKRHLEEGEELIISYGELTPIDFLVKYGTIPRQFVARPDMADKTESKRYNNRVNIRWKTSKRARCVLRCLTNIHSRRIGGAKKLRRLCPCGSF